MRFTRGVTLEPDTVRDFAREMNIDLGTSYEDVLADKSIDAVVLATPHTQHREQVEAAAAAGKHVFCEKPFALTVEDAKAAIAACRKAGVALGVGQNRRLWPSIVKLKEVVVFGRVRHHDVRRGQLQPRHSGQHAARQLALRAAGDQGRRHDRHGHSSARCVLVSDRADGARQRAFDQTRPAVRDRRHHAGDAGIPQRRDRHDRDLAEDAGLRVAACAVYGSEMWAESLSETKVTICRKDGKPETFDVPQTNHIGANLDSFAAAALGKGKFQIDDAGIVHTVAALEAVFASAERNGAWQDIA